MRVLALLLALTAFTAAAKAQTPPAPPPAITVQGEAAVAATPDTAEITAGVTSEARTAREAFAANSKAMGAVIAALRGAGIEERDIRTANVSIYPQSPPQRPETRQQITGYRVSNTVTVRVRDGARAGDILDAMVAAGANEAGGIRFIFSETSRLFDKAREEAVADARRKAEILARAAGAKLGRVLAIEEHGAGGGPQPMMRAEVAQSAPVMAGERNLRLGVTVSFEIAP